MNQKQRQPQTYQQPVEDQLIAPAAATTAEQNIREDMSRLSTLAQRFAIARQMINEKQMISVTREGAERVLTNNVQVGGE